MPFLSLPPLSFWGECMKTPPKKRKGKEKAVAFKGIIIKKKKKRGFLRAVLFKWMIFLVLDGS
jgi:hypothetical protein